MNGLTPANLSNPSLAVSGIDLKKIFGKKDSK